MNSEIYPMPVKIAGVGQYLPKRKVMSSELEQQCGLEPGWCERKQGVLERRWVEDETASYMAARAATEAAEDAGLDVSDVDCIINASATPEQIVPDGAALIQRQLGLGESGISCMSLHTTCMSFVTGLDVASCLLATGRYNRILVVSSDVVSTFLSHEIPHIYTLFGDAAAAAILIRTPNGERSNFLAALQRTYGVGADHARIPYGTKRHPSRGNIEPHDHLFHMNGRGILSTGGTFVPDFMARLMESCKMTMEDVKVLITHQASKITLDRLSLSVPGEKLVRIIGQLGNCAAASVPLTLYEAIKTERMHRGDRVLITGPAGAGMTIGGIMITY